MQTLHPGDRLLVVHPEDDEWHERLVTARVRKTSTYLMLTPDEDHYEVDLVVDLDQWVLLGVRGGVPSTVKRSGWSVYRFRHKYSQAEHKAAFLEYVGRLTELV